MKASSFVCFSALVGLSLFTSGCATMKPRASGALLDYKQLPAADEKGTRAFRSSVHQGLAREVRVAPVEILPEAGAGLSAESVSALAAKLDEELRLALTQAGLRVTSAPSAQNPAIQVRAVVTALNGSNPALNVVSVLAVGLPADPGGVAVELEAREAASGELVAARVEGRGGRPYQIFSGMKRTGHATAGFRKIAEDFALDLAAATGPAGVVVARN
jgi:hypothetical protein